MITGNMARDNYYQPGAMIPVFTSFYLPGADIQLDITGAWTTIVDSLAADFCIPTYTPPVDANAEVILSTLAAHSAANSAFIFGIFEGATLLLQTYTHAPINNGYVSNTTIWNGPLTAGTAYNFIAKYYNIAGGTHIHVMAGEYCTRLSLKVWRRP